MLIVLLGCGACSFSTKVAEAQYLTPEFTPVLTNSTKQLETLTPTPEIMPTFTNPPSPTKTITATVWTHDPLVPALVYHQFKPDDSGGKSTNLKMFLSDFRGQLETLYENGFCLVSLEDWLKGDMQVAGGCRPLILTMDDLYFNNQIRLTDEGYPSTETGIGVLWQFYREHTDFGFSIALFANLGDKLYANPNDPGWKDELARTIVWGIDNGAIPYNHFYNHPHLDRLTAEDITWEAMKNDEYLRELILKAGREDLIPRLGNIFALTYGVWPRIKDGINPIPNYVTPEGIPVLGIMEVSKISLAKFILPIYHPDFNSHQLPRIVADRESIDILMADVENFPQALSCTFDSVPVTLAEDEEYLKDQIGAAVASGSCPEGVYVLSGILFRAENSNVFLIKVE